MINHLKKMHADSWKKFLYAIIMVLFGISFLAFIIFDRFSIGNRPIPSFDSLIEEQGRLEECYYASKKGGSTWNIWIRVGNERKLFHIATASNDRFRSPYIKFDQEVSTGDVITIWYSEEKLPCDNGTVLQIEGNGEIFLDYNDCVEDLEKSQIEYKNFFEPAIILLFGMIVIPTLPRIFLKLLADLLYKLGILEGIAYEWHVDENGEKRKRPYIPGDVKRKSNRAKVPKQGNETISAIGQGKIGRIYMQPGQTVHIDDVILVVRMMGMEIPIISEGYGLVKEIYVKTGDIVQKGDALVSVEYEVEL